LCRGACKTLIQMRAQIAEGHAEGLQRPPKGPPVATQAISRGGAPLWRESLSDS
jgi:hypothetical protein